MAATKAKSTKSMATKMKKTNASTEFILEAPEANEVYLVGDFNDWNGEGFKMRKFKGGICKKSVKLKPGRYEYRFIVDGNWQTDPKNNERCTNPYGTDNSVIKI